jgi:hypothetical protein
VCVQRSVRAACCLLHVRRLRSPISTVHPLCHTHAPTLVRVGRPNVFSALACGFLLLFPIACLCSAQWVPSGGERKGTYPVHAGRASSPPAHIPRSRARSAPRVRVVARALQRTRTRTLHAINTALPICLLFLEGRRNVCSSMHLSWQHRPDPRAGLASASAGSRQQLARQQHCCGSSACACRHRALLPAALESTHAAGVRSAR